MNTRSKEREQVDSRLLSPDRSDDKIESELTSETNSRDIVAELATNLHKISFGEPSNVSVNSKITSSNQLREALPLICNEVFRVLGPYNLEATYQRALALELQDRGVTVLSEVVLPIEYKGQQIATRRVDLYLKLEKPVILELKAVTAGLKSDHMRQLKFYMTHLDVNEGYLINFPHISGFPDESRTQYIEHVLQPEGGLGVSDRVTRSSTIRKGAIANIIHVQVKKTDSICVIR
ncbi:GxxExxY protein [Plasmopara halstedii]|uniref:GxxExxY protein n=1 Tax=Plasmopara halstedii TaxID=4781 RepID=A0A0P1A6P8_PLAHL|nr:GxxExxY protein [Plasmopara halstedii]CEG35828.1 GxxExxY protein [Plasmopara halstedii]|eukprot:XP_024572197.1 GxxExxY protein [Plasmopara halstedii]